MSEQTGAQPESGADVDVAVEAEPTGPARVSWAPVPRVNLLPIEVLEGRRFRRTQVGLGVAVVAVVIAAGAGTVWAQRDVDEARDELTAAQAKVGSLQRDANRYSEVPKVLAEVDAADSARTRAMATDILWYRYLNDLDTARPPGLKLTSLTVAVTGTETGAPGKDVLTPNGVGTIQVNGVGPGYKDVATWLENLDKINGMSLPFLGSATGVDDTVQFTSGAVIDAKALSGRYDSKNDKKAG
jgi:Tfp pilus assembly protein PilN